MAVCLSVISRYYVDSAGRIDLVFGTEAGLGLYYSVLEGHSGFFKRYVVPNSSHSPWLSRTSVSVARVLLRKLRVLYVSDDSYSVVCLSVSLSVCWLRRTGKAVTTTTRPTTTATPFNGLISGTSWVSRYQKGTRSSAIADGPRDATCQSNSCQLLHNSVRTTCTTIPEQIEVMELERYSRPTYNVHKATTHLTVVGVIHKLTVDVDNTCTPTTCCGEIF